MKEINHKKPQVPDLPERYLLDLKTTCNLKCPMCLLHGSDEEEKKKIAIGKMDIEAAKEILDEIMSAKPLIQPSMWGEPLLADNLIDHITNMKKRGISVCFNTNGLTLTEKLASCFVDVKLDSIFFSVDAMTPETLKKVRGVDKLEKIARNVELMLKIRDHATFPRIGVSFTVQKENENETDEFVSHWIKIVDVVRVGAVFADGKLTGIKPPKERTPCHALYQTMPIHFNGDVSICCFDSFGEQVMGNVFKDGGVKAVWKGKKLQEARHYHETGQWDKVPFCKDCNAWSGYIYEDEVKDGILIRRSPQFIYYNRMDRLESWHKDIRGHEHPDL